MSQIINIRITDENAKLLAYMARHYQTDIGSLVDDAIRDYYSDERRWMVAEQTEPSLVKDSPSLVKDKPTTEDCSMVDPLHDDCFDCDKFFTCDNKGEDYKTDCPWK